MKVVDRVLWKRLHIIVTVGEAQFGFLPERDTIYAVLILIWLQEQYHAKRKELYMWFVYLEKAIYRVPKRVLKW